jgi:hypothetical protein
MMSKDIFSLPTELVSRVVTYLNTNDFCNFRRSCSEIEKKTFNSFAKAFFTTKQFMFTHTSLQALIDISQHEALGPHLKKVIIGTNAIPSPHDALSSPLNTLMNSNTGPRTDRQKHEHWREYNDQLCLTEMGTDVVMLAKAFVRMPSARICISLSRSQMASLA